MEYWGVEVKAGEALKVEPGAGMVLHLSQASLGEVKKDKGSENICLFVNVDGSTKMVLATLISDKLPQQQFDLVFDTDFELSHNWKSGSVYFFGYKADNPDEEDYNDEFDSDSEEEEEDLPLTVKNGKPETKDKQVKPAGVEKANAVKDAAAGKQKGVKIVEPSKNEEDDEDSEDGSDEDMSSDDAMGEDEDESDSDEDSDEDEETPKKVETGKKRAAESASKTPVSGKKAKLATPQKTDGKKGGVHVATPHPSKQAGKTPANKSNQPTTPKSGGSHSCGTCKKTFNSENALSSHSKAKHSAGK